MPMISSNSAAILLSRQPLRPSGQTAWIQSSRAAVQWVRSHHLSLLTSIGMQTWELLVYLAKEENVHQFVVIPPIKGARIEKQKQWLKNEFGIDKNSASFLTPSLKENSLSPKAALIHRDRFIVNEAKLVLPVSIRPHGHMDQFIGEKAALTPEAVCRQFSVEYQNRKQPISYGLDKNRIPEKVLKFNNDFIVHWTRTANGPWPDEMRYHYFKALTNATIYPRKAFDTLKNILKCRKIIASSANMPKYVSTVSFSGLPLDNVFQLMRYSKRKVSMSFEPYGIGIRRAFAEQYGIFPVHYHEKTEHRKQVPSWLKQSKGKRGDWEQEDEYRCLGDLDLKSVPAKNICCFCLTQTEADSIENKFGINALSFT